MLNNALKTIKKFLSIFCIFLFFILIFTKNKIYKIKSDIRDVDDKIIRVEKEKEIINLELAYLSNPNRLKKIYAKIQNMNISNIDTNNNVILVKKQIKNMRELIPYYYTNANNNKDSIAKK